MANIGMVCPCFKDPPGVSRSGCRCSGGSGIANTGRITGVVVDLLTLGVSPGGSGLVNTGRITGWQWRQMLK